MDSYFLTKMSGQHGYRFIRVTEMLLGHESVFSLAETRNSDDSGSKSFGISRLDDDGLYTEKTKELPIFTKAPNNFAKNPQKPAFFTAPTFYTTAKTFRGKLKAAFVVYHTDSAFEYVEFLNARISHMRTTSNPLLQIIFSCMNLHTYEPKDNKGTLKACSEGFQCRFV